MGTMSVKETRDVKGSKVAKKTSKTSAVRDVQEPAHVEKPTPPTEWRDTDIREPVDGRVWSVLRGFGGCAFNYVGEFTSTTLPDELPGIGPYLLAQDKTESITIINVDGWHTIIKRKED
jgi:hypothetical protein